MFFDESAAVTVIALHAYKIRSVRYSADGLLHVDACRVPAFVCAVAHHTSVTAHYVVSTFEACVPCTVSFVVECEVRVLYKPCHVNRILRCCLGHCRYAFFSCDELPRVVCRGVLADISVVAHAYLAVVRLDGVCIAYFGAFHGSYPPYCDGLACVHIQTVSVDAVVSVELRVESVSAAFCRDAHLKTACVQLGSCCPLVGAPVVVLQPLARLHVVEEEFTFGNRRSFVRRRGILCSGRCRCHEHYHVEYISFHKMMRLVVLFCYFLFYHASVGQCHSDYHNALCSYFCRASVAAGADSLHQTSVC